MNQGMIRFLEELGRPRVAVVGDLMLDEYVWGEVERISPEAPIPVVRVAHREWRVGGAGSVVINLARLECDVDVFGVVGDDQPGLQVREIFESEGVCLDGLLTCDDRRTTLKTRLMGYVQHADRAVQQMLRIDDEEQRPLSHEHARRLLSSLSHRADDIDGVLVSDYGKGLVTSELLEGIRVAVRGKPILVDPARLSSYALYRETFLICPNRYEARLASGIPCDSLADCERAATKILEENDFEAVAVTLDRDGIFLACRDGAARHFPTPARVVADVTGAGDTVLTVLGVVIAAGGDLGVAVGLANVAAGIEIRHLGVTPISRAELLQELRFQGHPVVGKIKALSDLVALANQARRQGRTVVFTNGCFDLLHLGHHHLLNNARREGDLLIVAVNSDESIRRLKGEGRPKIGQKDRVLMLAGLEAVDYVIVFEEETPNHLLEALRPDVLVKGSEYRTGVVVGREIVEGYGGRVVFVEQLPGISTTALLDGR